MPQGRRKIPFSAKQKKIQLQQKRDRKRNTSDEKGTCFQVKKEKQEKKYSSEEEEENTKLELNKFNEQPTRQNWKSSANKYNLHFLKDKEDAEKNKKIAHETIVSVSQKELEIGIDQIFLERSELDFPKRPPWTYSMSRRELEKQENKYFQEYVINIQKKFDIQELSYFEMNLETWRQLWRVLEMSDIILIIIDIRFPSLLFPPSLFAYIKNDLKKHVILIFNKIDLVDASLVLAWKQYFMKKFPELYIVYFTSFPKMTSEQLCSKVHKVHHWRLGAVGAKQLLAVCQDIVKESVDLSSWNSKIEEDLNAVAVTAESKISVTEQNSNATYEEQHENFKDGILTIGCVGYPNVGKSSIINALMGQKVVSVSRTPGHTKHFQTIFLTPTVKLCDCPGLVFPSVVPKSLQILCGSFPIAQVRNPYAAVKYLAERILIVELLRLKMDAEKKTDTVNDSDWSAWDICEGWAQKRGYKTAKAARLDTYRAANGILRMALDGRLCLSLYPPSYLEKKAILSEHPEIGEIKAIQEKNTDELNEENLIHSEESSENHYYSSDSSEKIDEDITSSSEEEEMELKDPNKFAILNME